MADGVFEFENTERAIEYGTTLHVRKMRRTVLSTRTIKITLMPSGMVAETASRI
jgi:KaiC/GvpD/RAD55 family RecA-like ATPase